MEERYTIAGLIRAHAAEQPDDVMFVDGDERQTWDEHYRRACQVARALEAEGLGLGDRVAFLDRNGTVHFEVLFGCALLGAVNVPLNWRLAAAEIAQIVADSRTEVLVVHPDYARLLEHMDDGLPTVRRIVVIGDPKEGADAGGATDAGRRVGYEDWLDAQPASAPGHVGPPEEVSVQFYTSGTTGLPKGVMLTNSNLATALHDAVGTFNIDDTTVSLIAMPLFHIGGSGWALCGMSRGGKSVILRDVDPNEVLRLIETERVTATFVVPAVLMFLLVTPGVEDRDYSSLRDVFYGAAPIAEDVLINCMRVFKCRFTQLYGMTETPGTIAALRAEDHDPGGPRHHLLRSAGTPLPGVELRIVVPDTNDEEAGVGHVGEIWARSPYNMAGYWENPAETATTIRDGWLHTGDAGYIDADGYLFLHDRIKDMVVTGGENVYPTEVENVILSDPRVADAAVIGVPDEKWGEAVKAIVVRASLRRSDGTEPVTERELIALCKKRLAGFKCPKTVEFVESLPRNPTGKVLKKDLRAPYWEGQARHIS